MIALRVPISLCILITSIGALLTPEALLSCETPRQSQESVPILDTRIHFAWEEMRRRALIKGFPSTIIRTKADLIHCRTCCDRVSANSLQQRNLLTKMRIRVRKAPRTRNTATSTKEDQRMWHKISKQRDPVAEHCQQTPEWEIHVPLLWHTVFQKPYGQAAFSRLH